MNKAKVFRRDNWECQKCGRQALERNTQNAGLVIHHILPRNPVDGGTDALKNLITLCSPCHHEWHALEMVSSFLFTEWLNLPTLHLLVSFVLLTPPEELSAREAHRVLLDTHNLHKEKRRELKNEDEFQKWVKQSRDAVMSVWTAGESDFFAGLIANRTREVLRDMRTRNQKYGHVPYGFRAVPNHSRSNGKARYDLVPDEAQQATIQEMAEMHRAGASLAKIARHLNYAHKPSPFCRVRYHGKLVSGLWRHGSVRAVLQRVGAL